MLEDADVDVDEEAEDCVWDWYEATEGAKILVIPWEVRRAGMCATARGAVTMRHVRERWLRRPHGDPSGVCTGHRKPRTSQEWRSVSH